MSIQKVMEQEDLVITIEEKLVLYEDKVRFRAVSKLWNSIPPKVPDLRAKQLPWMIYELCDDNSEASHGLFNPVDKNNYLLDLKEFLEKPFGGSCHGWVLIIDEDSYQLVNPLTKARFEIPQWSNYLEITMSKVIWSSPPSSEDFVLVGCDTSEDLVYFWSKDKKPWWFYLQVLDIIFHKGKLHVLTVGETTGDLRVVVFQSIKNSRKYKNSGSGLPTSPADGLRYYLVESSDEELMVVVLESDCPHRFEAYEYHPRFSHWFRVKSIGDQVIFILNDDNISSGIAVSCRDFPEFKGNHIYFSGYKYRLGVCCEVFNLEDKTIEFGFPCGPMNVDYPTVWVTPSLI